MNINKENVLKFCRWVLSVNIQLGFGLVLPFMTLAQIIAYFALPTSSHVLFRWLIEFAFFLLHYVFWLLIYWYGRKVICFYIDKESNPTSLVEAFGEISRYLFYSFALQILWNIYADVRYFMSAPTTAPSTPPPVHDYSFLSARLNDYFHNGGLTKWTPFLMPTTSGLSTLILAILFLYLTNVVRRNISLKEEVDLTV